MAEGHSSFLLPLPCYLWNSNVPSGNITGSVHQSGRNHVLEKGLFEGMGYASQIIFYASISYIVVLAWAFLYFFASVSGELPWTNCNNVWNTDHCVAINNYNGSANWTSSVNASSSSSVLEFWQRRVLNISTGIETIGNIRWDLSFCLLLSWTICYFYVWKGVRSTGKVWMDAGTQIFYLFALCLGFLTTLGSYNKYNNDCYRDSFYICLVNSGSSFLSGFAVFSILGYMSQKQGVDISIVAESGPRLVFIVYPQAVTLLPWPQFWSMCFFSMIILLGIDSQFVGLESIITSLSEVCPFRMRKGYHRELFLLLIRSCSFIFGLVLVSEAGIYILQIFAYYVCSGPTLLMMAIFQSVVIGWIYGAGRFSDNIKDMIGYKPLPLIKYCWLYAIPFLCFGTFVFLLLRYTPMRFNNSYVYPWWAYCIGWFLSLSSLSMIPLNMMWKLAKGKGTIWERLKMSCQPAKDRPGMSREMENDEASLTECL